MLFQKIVCMFVRPVIVNVYALYRQRFSRLSGDLSGVLAIGPKSTKSVDGTPSQSIIHSATDSGDYYHTAVHCALV